MNFRFFGIVLLLLALMFTSCANPEKEFNSLLGKLANKDKTIDSEDWQQIVEFIDANKADWKDFYADGNLDNAAVQEYIVKHFQSRRNPIEVQFQGIGAVKPYLTVKFYLERSGSMTPYDAKDCYGEFKSAIVKLLNSLPGEDTDNTLYVVNSEVNKYPEGIKQFIHANNIFESTKGMGDASFTDFGLIFDEILNKNKSGEISILVTDMIYSPKDAAGINPHRVFTEAQGIVSNVFKNQVKSKSMLVLKMSSSYSGPYYPYNVQSKGVAYKGNRPYYIVMVGDNADIARLSSEEKYADFIDFKHLKGFENLYLFDASGVYSPYYGFLLKSKDTRGEFRAAHGQGEQITNLEKVKADRKSGDIQLALGINLDNMFIDPDYLLDPNNYIVDSSVPVKIKSIRPIEETTDLSVNQNSLRGKMTHVITLTTDKAVRNEEISIKLLNKLPGWVEKSSSDDDTNLSAATFPATTFGLKYIMNGIYDSYKKLANGTQPVYFTIKLKLNN